MKKNIDKKQKPAERVKIVYKSHKGKGKSYLKRFGSRPKESQ